MTHMCGLWIWLQHHQTLFSHFPTDSQLQVYNVDMCDYHQFLPTTSFILRAGIAWACCAAVSCISHCYCWHQQQTNGKPPHCRAAVCRSVHTHAHAYAQIHTLVLALVYYHSQNSLCGVYTRMCRVQIRSALPQVYVCKNMLSNQ